MCKETVPWIEEVPLPDPSPLIGGRFMHPEATTVLYGHGGTGKGLIASHVTKLLVGEGIRVGVLDFEQMEWEWRPRLDGVAPGMVWYEQFAEDIAASNHFIRQLIGDCALQAIIVDSASRAQPEPLKGQGDSAVVRKMFQILKGFGCPCLVIAHVPKSGMKEGEAPRHVPNPLGSVHWTTQARCTYSAIRIDTQGNITTVETKCMKINDRRRPDPRMWEFYHDTGEVRMYPRGHRAFSVSREIWKLLDKTRLVMTAAEISLTLRADFPQHEGKFSRLQVQRLLYRRQSQLFRKVTGGWVSIDSDMLFDTVNLDEDV